MKQVININFQGQVVPIEVSAFETLKNYIESLRRYFANEEGREEIINDIESRIAELFQERLKAGSTCITDDDVSAIIASMGRPEDFEETTGAATASAGSTENNEQQKSAPGQTTGHKRLYRDEDNKILGGVCAGLANYFNMDPVIARIIFVILFFAFGFGIIPYIIFWIAVPSNASTVIGGSRKKFFRDPDHKIIAGVCSGIGNYFGINAWIPRVLFLLPFISIVFRWGHWGFYDFPSFVNFSFSPGSVIVYIIMWLVFAEANTTAEKLEMKGEKVDMNSIKNSVVEEMKGVGQRVQKFGEEATEFAKEKGKAASAEFSKSSRRGRSLGDFIALLVKGFVYFILAMVCFGLVIGLFTVGIFSIGIFPLKDYVITDGWQNFFAWGTLVLFIAAPIIGVITWVIRRITRMRGNSKRLRWAFGGLWAAGWFFFISFIASVAADFRTNNHEKIEEVVLTNPGINKLEVSNGMAQNFYHRRGFRLQPFDGFEPGDTLFVNNVDLYITKSTNDSFRVTMEKVCSGYKQAYADTTAALMDYKIFQRDSILQLPRGIAITERNKFRNQRIVLTIYVPIGKQIRINRNVEWNNGVFVDGPFNGRHRWDEGPDYDNVEHGWDYNTDYKMTAQGLTTLDGVMADYDKRPKKKNSKANAPGDDDNDDNDASDDYRYDNRNNNNSNPPMNRADSLKMKLQQQNDRVQDSLKKVIQKAQEMLDKPTSGKGQSAFLYNNSILPVSGPMISTI